MVRIAYREISKDELRSSYNWLTENPLYESFRGNPDVNSPSLNVAKSIVRSLTDTDNLEVLEVATNKGGSNTKLVYLLGLGFLEASHDEEAIFFLNSYPHRNSNPPVSTIPLEKLTRIREPESILKT